LLIRWWTCGFLRHGVSYYRCKNSQCYNLNIPQWMNVVYRYILIYLKIIIKIIRGATALTNLGRLSSRRWRSFPTAPDGTGLTCGQHIESHSCIFSFINRTVTSLFK
jgi:hypothetical protein